MPRNKEHLPPPLTIAGASDKRGAQRRSREQKEHNGARATILDWAPYLPCPPPELLRALKRDASNANNDPSRPQGPDHSLWKGYQESTRQNGRRETQMEADDKEGQSLPEQGERIWRRQQRRRRESAFTSGSRLPSYQGLPPSRLPARRRKGPEGDPFTIP